jgi:hypothetical protein
LELNWILIFGYTAFAWLRCNREPDCQAFLKARGIIARSGHHFGAGPEFVRLSMLERNHSFELVVQRLASLQMPDWNLPIPMYLKKSLIFLTQSKIFPAQKPLQLLPVLLLFLLITNLCRSFLMTTDWLQLTFAALD